MFTTIRRLFGERTADHETGLITIVFGGKSGNAEFVGSETFRHLKEKGKKVRLKNMSSFKPEMLAGAQTVLFVVSTHGEGDPPPAALRFFRQLNNSQLRLPDLEFSVCALGDSEYEHFCQAGKELEKRLLRMGAQVFSPRVDCDAAFETAAAEWISTVSGFLTDDETEPLLNLEGHQNRSWHNAVVREKRQLNPGAADAVFHLSLAIDDQQLRYQSGDSVGIIPQNPVSLVEQLLASLQLSPDLIIDSKEQLTLRHFLLSKVEITNLNKALLQRYLLISDDDNLADLLQNEAACLEYLHQHDFLDLLHDFPFPFQPSALVVLLDKLKVRYYSIASYQPAHPGEIHLTVKQLRFQHKNRLRYGSCSNYLSQWLEVGTPLSFCLAPDETFRLPDHAETPVIFIAAGTGIAPVRAFLKERESLGQTRNWLIFGEKTRKLDYLYGDEIDLWKEKGLLERLNLAFSRDQSAKLYVQDVLLKQGTGFLNWIDAGASVYVCGSLKMGIHVKETIGSLLASREGSTTVEQLQAAKRYCEDIY